MSTPSSQLDQADRELLVAYLDGELSSQDSAVVESRLAGDESFRRELHELQRAWDALNQLPRPAAAEEFTRTTLEMVAIAAQEDVDAATTALPSQRRRYLSRILGVIVAAILLGVLLARIIWPDRNGELVANLPVIENVEVYRHLGDLEFLRLLYEREGGHLERISPLGDEEVDQSWRHWQAVSHEDESARRRRIVNLEPAAAGSLTAKWKRFETLEEETEKLVELHESLLQDEQSQQLYATAIRFGELLSRRSAGDKADLRSKTESQERLEVVDDWLDRERPQRRRELSIEDRVKLIEFQRNMFGRRRDRRGPGPPSQEEREAFHQELNKLIDSLSPEAQQDLKDGRGDPDYGELLGWMRDAAPSWQREDLEEFFLSIEDNDEKARLLLLPDHEMLRQLRGRYLGPFEGWWRERGRRGPPGPDGRRRGEGPERRRGDDDRDGRGVNRDGEGSSREPNDDQDADS